MTRAAAARALLCMTAAACAAAPGADPGAGDGDDGAEPTYYRDVAPILAAHCADCHMGETAAPRVHLEGLAGAAEIAGLLERVLPAREMPPWGMDDSGACGTWQHARWMSDGELATVSAWIAAGAPAGAPADPDPPPPTASPSLRQDLVLAPDAPYTPELGAGAVRCFVVDPALAGDRLLTGIEVMPDSRWGVEQVTLFALDSPEADEDAAARDAGEPGPGYTCLAGPMTAAEHLVTGTSWIDRAEDRWVSRLPAGTGLRLRAGRRLVLQVHYNLVAGIAPRDVAVALELADADGDRVTEAFLEEIAARDFVLGAGLPTTAVAALAPLGEELTVLGVYPRMRFLGHSLAIDLVSGPRTGCLADLRHWDLHQVQKLFATAEPVVLPTGTVARVTCSYTTLGRELPVHASDEPDGEECRAYLYVTR